MTVADGRPSIDTPEKDSSGSTPGVIDELYLSQLEGPSTNPRFGGFEIDKLARSIQSVGLLQPIIVRPKNNHYEIIAGHRRFAACRELNWRKISCHVIELDDKSAFELSLIENIQRQTMDPLEEAEAFRRYVEQYGWGSAMQLATKIGKSSAYISKRISLLNLSPDVIQRIKSGEIRPSIAEEISRVESSKEQSQLAMMVSSRRLSLRDVRRLVDNRTTGKPSRDDQCYPFSTEAEETSDDEKKSDKALSKAAIALKIALNRLAAIMEDVEDDWFIYEQLLLHKNILHNEIDHLLKEKKKVRRFRPGGTQPRTLT